MGPHGGKIYPVSYPTLTATATPALKLEYHTQYSQRVTTETTAQNRASFMAQALKFLLFQIVPDQLHLSIVLPSSVAGRTFLITLV